MKKKTIHGRNNKILLEALTEKNGEINELEALTA